MSLKITTLIENSQGEHLGLKTEHGISFYIEKDDTRLLFDSGESDAFIYNANRLNIDLKKTDKVVLSHGHYDHTGGLVALNEIFTDYELFLGTGFFEEKYGYRNNSYEFLGNCFTEEDLISKKIKYSFVSNRKTEIAEDIFIITNFIRNNDDEIINPRFKLYKNNSFIPDPFNDEVLIAIKTPKGIVVLVGCSHPGIKNMIDTVEKEFDQEVYTVLGGTHLVEANEKSLAKSVEYLGNSNIKILGVSHCTGAVGVKKLEGKKNFFHNSTGSMIYLDF